MSATWATVLATIIGTWMVRSIYKKCMLRVKCVVCNDPSEGFYLCIECRTEEVKRIEMEKP